MTAVGCLKQESDKCDADVEESGVHGVAAAATCLLGPSYPPGQ